MVEMFIPSYHRPDNQRTLKFMQKIGYDMSKITIFLDSEADDKAEYEKTCKAYGCKLAVFDMEESRKRYDYVHRASVSRRSAGQARNMFHDYARAHNIDFYCVSDDDTTHYDIRVIDHVNYRRVATLEDIEFMMTETEKFMRDKKIGCFGWSQNGDFFGPENKILFRKKIMNTTFYLLPYVYRGERGVQDNDTSQFVSMMNCGLFSGSFGCGVSSPNAKRKAKGWID